VRVPVPSRPKFRGLPIRPEDEGEGLVPWEWAVEQLEASRNYWLCTTRPDGSPHAMPLWGVWLDAALYFDTHPESQKVRNLTAQPRAVVHVESGSEVVILEGTVDVEEDASKRASCSSGSRRRTRRSTATGRSARSASGRGSATRGAETSPAAQPDTPSDRRRAGARPRTANGQARAGITGYSGTFGTIESTTARAFAAACAARGRSANLAGSARPIVRSHACIHISLAAREAVLDHQGCRAARA
jgi:hypothetical protein